MAVLAVYVYVYVYVYVGVDVIRRAWIPAVCALIYIVIILCHLLLQAAFFQQVVNDTTLA